MLALKLGAREPALTNDARQRADLKLSIVGNGDGDGRVFGPPLHDNVASFRANFLKSDSSQYLAALLP